MPTTATEIYTYVKMVCIVAVVLFVGAYFTYEI